MCGVIANEATAHKRKWKKKRTELNGMELICDGVHIRHFTYLVIAFSHPFLLFNSFYVILTIIEHSSRLNMQVKLKLNTEKQMIFEWLIKASEQNSNNGINIWLIKIDQRALVFAVRFCLGCMHRVHACVLVSIRQIY